MEQKQLSKQMLFYTADNTLLILIVFGQREELVRINIKSRGIDKPRLLICFRTGTSKVSYMNVSVNLFAFHLFFGFKTKCSLNFLDSTFDHFS